MSLSSVIDVSARNLLRDNSRRLERLEGQMATFIKNNTTVLYHSNLQNLDYASSGHVGFASSADLSSHTGDATIHFTEGSIDHTAITNIGTNTHAQIDAHISLGDVANEATDTTCFPLFATAATGTLGPKSNAGLTFNSATARLAVSNLGVGVSPSTLDELDVDGAILVTHTSTESDDHALEIDCDAAGFGDVKAVDVSYITGAVSTGSDEAVILINIDETAATGGDLIGLDILATEGSADKITGLFAGIGVSPIDQLSGTFGDAASILNNAVDVLAALSSGGAGNISVFVADNDTVTIGLATKFEELEFILDTPASGAGIAPTFEFSTGVGTWTTFSPIDGTNGLRNTGVVAWTDSDIPTWAAGAGSEFLIRVTRTRNSLSTTPIVDKVQVSAATEYRWDESGVITAGGANLSGALTMGANQITGVADPTLAQDAATKAYVDASVAPTESLVHKGSSAPSGSETVWIDTTNDPTSWAIKFLGPSGSWFEILETS